MYILLPIILSTFFFVLIIIVFTRERMDYVAYSILGALVCALVFSYYYGTKLSDYIGFIEFEPLIFIISMQIIVTLVEEVSLFEWIAIKTLHIAKAEPRKFFYLISIMAAMSSVFVSDITVALIFFPIIIRATKTLEINPVPYLFGAGFTINVGSVYSPFSSSENILIALSFHKNFVWFLANFSLIVIPLILLTLFILDKLVLKKNKQPTERRKRLLLEIMNPSLIIKDRKKFYLNAICFIIILVGFAIIPNIYIVAAFGAIIMCLLNRRLLHNVLKKIDWKIIFFFVALFVLIGCMEIDGSIGFLSNFTKTIMTNNIIVSAIVILILSSLLSAFLANVPTTLIFINLISVMYLGQNVPDILIIALLLGVNLGANLLPQGAAKNLIALNLAKANNIEGYNYKSLTKYGAIFALIHIAVCILYLVCLVLL